MAFYITPADGSSDEKIKQKVESAKAKAKKKGKAIIELDAKDPMLEKKLDKLGTLAYQKFGTKEDEDVDDPYRGKGALLIVDNYEQVKPFAHRVKIGDLISYFASMAGCSEITISHDGAEGAFDYFKEFPNERDTGSMDFVKEDLLKEAFLAGYRAGRKNSNKNIKES